MPKRAMDNLKAVLKERAGDKMRDKSVKMSENANKMRDRLVEILHEMPTEMTVGEVADYLLNNGTIVMPCKAGSTVYKLIADKREKKPYEFKVVGFWCSEEESRSDAHLVRFIKDKFDCSFCVPITEFGKTVFLTEEEAERALKEVSDYVLS